MAIDPGPIVDPVPSPPPAPAPARRLVDMANSTRERGTLSIFADGTAVQQWVVKDEHGAVVGIQSLTLTQAEVNAMLDNPAEKVTGTDGTKRTPLRHIRNEIAEVRKIRKSDVVWTYVEPLTDTVGGVG